jgi:DNA-binding CsgD family transcriptional regulator
MHTYDSLVSQIYDCAANPELWPQALSSIRDRLGAAYVLVSATDLSVLPLPEAPGHMVFRNSPWDESWFAKLGEVMHLVPGIEILAQAEIDTALVHSAVVPDEIFLTSEFYARWVEPQGIRDTISIPFLKRPQMQGAISIPSPASRDKYSAEDGEFAGRLAPHIRRAILINDMIDKGRMAQILYRKVLDALTSAVIVVGAGRRFTFANAVAEELLSQGNFLTVKGDVLATKRENGASAAFNDAIERASRGDTALGVSGIGVPLVGLDGERAAAYVLPLGGGDVRGELGQGFAAVFVARRAEQQPLVIEILRTVYDLTQTEARISATLANGEGVDAIASSFNVKPDTVRSHIKKIYVKIGVNRMPELVSRIKQLVPPVAG